MIGQVIQEFNGILHDKWKRDKYAHFFIVRGRTAKISRTEYDS